MKLTHKKGLIRLAIFLSVLLPCWAFKEYFVCWMLLVFMVGGYVVYWLVGKLFDVDPVRNSTGPEDTSKKDKVSNGVD